MSVIVYFNDGTNSNIVSSNFIAIYTKNIDENEVLEQKQHVQLCL